MKNRTLKPIVAMIIIASFATAAFALQAATRIQFARGKSSATVKGAVLKSGKKDYVLRGNRGQEFLKDEG